eukprot:TRINITY_DN14159_c0_g1_i1.p1 TRINITY_DN14159_c0_g1~~TRINITY_DN14159_c0_g1_i1.p1  ORF type:complete len:104 (+),score=2.36 TRINITY_DN14159_c0_g1_i1:61-372(+)
MSHYANRAWDGVKDMANGTVTRGAAVGAAAGGALYVGTVAVTSVALPSIMSYTGTVVAGVGTIQSSITPIAAGIATGSGAAVIAPVLIVGGAVVGAHILRAKL